MDARLLYPVAVTLLSDATKVVLAAVMLEESGLKDAKPRDATELSPVTLRSHSFARIEVSVARILEELIWL